MHPEMEMSVGAVIPFRRREELRLCRDERELLHRLRGSLPAMWRGGWAAPGEHGGVTLLRNQHCLGLWCRELGMFVYRPIESGEVTIKVATVEDVHGETLLLLGDLQSL